MKNAPETGISKGKDINNLSQCYCNTEKEKKK